MSIEYTLDFQKSKDLLEMFQQLAGRNEELVNDYFERIAAKRMMEDIIGFIPISRKNKKHAKTSNPLKVVYSNLGFTIKSKGGAASNKNSYGYLVFPDQGIGYRNPLAQEFSLAGKEKSEDLIIRDLEEIFTEAISKYK